MAAFSFSGSHGNRNKKTVVNTRVVDDRLKIIDDVPSSAVEMSVKEKVSFFSYRARTMGFPKKDPRSQKSKILMFYKVIIRKVKIMENIVF